METNTDISIVLQASKDRSYLIKVKDQYEEIKLNGRVVNWLTGMNTERRNESNVDKTFIKVLLIAVFTVRFIKSGDEFEAGSMDFIKGQFEWNTNTESNHFIIDIFSLNILDLFYHRVNGDDSRESSFETLVETATNEIRME